jgi:hypothetical protein
MMGQSEQGIAARSYLLHYFLQVHNVVATFTNCSNLQNYAEPNQRVLEFLHPILLCRITTIVPWLFSTNYIIFRNVEIVKK